MIKISDDGLSVQKVIGESGIVNIPEGITTISTNAFANSNIVGVVLPSTITIIKTNAFQECHNIKSITIPDSIEIIESHAFSGCRNLISITLPNKNILLGVHVFDGCDRLGIIFHNNTLYHFPKYFSGQYTIPQGTRKIYDEAFMHCEGLTGIEMPDSLQEIGEMAFWGCSNLTQIELPNSLRRIGYRAFKDTKIQAIRIPASMNQIWRYSFADMPNLRKVETHDGIKAIKCSAFENCIQLMDIKIPLTVQEIDPYAFKNCPCKDILENQNKEELCEDKKDANYEKIKNAMNKTIDIQKNKDVFKQLLRSTQRAGIDNVINKLEELGFFEAPASSNNHLNVPGGLVQHSLNVYRMAKSNKENLLQIMPELADRLSDSSIIIAALLHDVCKAEIYKSATKKRKNKLGYWEEYKGYDVDCSAFPIGHGEKSVIQLLRWGLSLTEDEMLAIRWHMTAWDLPFQSYEQKENLNKAKEKCPLLTLVQTADGLATGILEM